MTTIIYDLSITGSQPFDYRLQLSMTDAKTLQDTILGFTRWIESLSPRQEAANDPEETESFKNREKVTQYLVERLNNTTKPSSPLPERDSNGVIFDPKIHVGVDRKSKTGAWIKKRVAKSEEPTAPLVQPVSVNNDTPVCAPTPPAVDDGDLLPSLYSAIHRIVSGDQLTSDQILKVLNRYGCETMLDVSSHPQHIPAILDELRRLC